jgi:signal transduction histidine kinase
VSVSVADDYQPPLTRRGHVGRIAGVLLITASTSALPLFDEWTLKRWLFGVDIVLGAAAFVLMFWRRRHPLAVCLAVLALTAVSSTASGPAVLVLVSLATRRVRWQMYVAGAVSFAADLTAWFVVVPIPFPIKYFLFFNLIPIAAVLGWGQFIGSRRELTWNLRQRAERAEAEQEHRAAEARAHERTRIAREMHDVVAHRISQVSMRAAAMAFRTDLTADQMRAESALVQDSANAALRELRIVLQVLRDPDSGVVIEQPQPTLQDIALLIEQAQAAGMPIDLDDTVNEDPPSEIGRTIYRILQEGITNASKHSPGQRVTIALSGNCAAGYAVTVSNPIVPGLSTPPGAGLGLLGCAERVAVTGGTFTHDIVGNEFKMTATLPCAP